MVRSACKTDRGVVRRINEDAMLCMENKGFFMLADGVGGHNSGEVASGLAVELAEEYIGKYPITKVDDSEIFFYLFDCLESINETICKKASQNPECFGMATTSIISIVRNGKAYIANVGDSRAYVLQKGIFSRATEDHTYVNELIKDGKISKDEAENHPKRNVITRALGCEDLTSPDFYKIELSPGDRVLLCTDGLYNEVDEDTLGKFMKTEKDVDVLIEKLVTLACQNGGRDNITVSCVDIIDSID